MGGLPQSPVEVRLAATLFLLLLGLADLFGAWEVRTFASFTPGGVAATVGASEHAMHDMSGAHPEETPVDLATLNETRHHIDRSLLVQDTHVHVPAYAMTAALLSLIVFALRLTSRARIGVILVAFAAPFVDFLGLWGAHLSDRGTRVWGALAVLGGVLMGLVYLVVLVVTLWQCWFERKGEAHA